MTRKYYKGYNLGILKEMGEVELEIIKLQIKKIKLEKKLIETRKIH